MKLRLRWVKSSYKRYVAEESGLRASIAVVRSGRAKFLNERWHPDVFGNHFAGPSDGFDTVSEAQEAAEEIARSFAAAALVRLGTPGSQP